jgi:hypothetical protein
MNKIKYLLEDILYMIEQIDEQGFSNERIKDAVKENVKEILENIKGEK